MESFPPLTLIEDMSYLSHDTGGVGHPENPARLQVIKETLELSSWYSSVALVSPNSAAREDIKRVHGENWLFRFEEAVLRGNTYIDHIDNQVCYDSYNVACLAAGAGITAINLIENGGGKNIFCLVRPPGHHAEHSNPFGFCFFNNCVIAARYWQKHYNKKRVLIFDFDAHHGNGIQSAFEEESGSYYISIHEHPSFSYPGTGYRDENGLGKGKGSILNLPLQPGDGDIKVMDLLDNVIPKKLADWQPDAIIIAAGFDAHCEDHMSGLCFSTDLYYKIGRKMKIWADKYTEGHLLSILEGGYELSVLGLSVESYLRGLTSE